MVKRNYIIQPALAYLSNTVVLPRIQVMKTSSNGNIFALLALCAGNLPVTGELPLQRPVTRSFNVFFDLCLNKLLSKPSRRRWFEKQFCSLWRHCNAVPIGKTLGVKRCNISEYLPVPSSTYHGSPGYYIYTCIKCTPLRTVAHHVTNT